MTNKFFEQPILNSPYEYPTQHWELDKDGQPTQQIIPSRRRADFVTPIPKARKRGKSTGQKTGRTKDDPRSLVIDEGLGLSSEKQQYSTTAMINLVREHVDPWRKIPDRSQWRVTPETARLLEYWRHHAFSGIRPFFCQVEAVETIIWLTEVAPSLGKRGKAILDYLERASLDANAELLRLALKMATGAGKTTVMAMIIAWQTVNAVRRPGSKRFTRGFLVVTPGITIRDRLRVLYPSDLGSYYANRELVPQDMLEDLHRAKIVITNYHAFKLRGDQGPTRGRRQGQEAGSGYVLDSRREQRRPLWPLGRRGIHRGLQDRNGFRGQGAGTVQ